MESGNTIQSMPNPKHVFILSGQSNMAGRGGVIPTTKQWDRIVPPECRPDPKRILRLNANLNWEPAHDPLHADIDTNKTCGVGPGMSFANAIKETTNNQIGLVPCAVGGTAIKEWARGTDLYENMIKRAKIASEEEGEIKAVLWYQGESDTMSFEDAECYKSKMEELIRNVREDLDSPRLPVIQVVIASGDDKYLEKVRQAQKSIDLPEVGFVDSGGLLLKEDNLHLTTEAQVKLGLMLAHTYIQSFKSPTDRVTLSTLD